MKKIFILAASVLFISSCNMKKSNSEQALQDSIRVADSMAVVEAAAYEAEKAAMENDEIQTSSGYSSDPNYKPTISSDGKYHTIDGKARQKEFQGSLEQKQQLEMLDE